MFASGVLGKCIGVIPDNGNIFAPCSGTVTMLADTSHAICIHTDSGHDVLVHVGINTVTLGGKGFSALFETYALMAEDPDFEDAVKDAIDTSSLSARSAVLEAGNNLALIFESMDDEYMRQRSSDIKDVAQRIASVICGDKGNLFDFSSPVILVADDFTPSQTILLDKNSVKGFILYKGTKNGHTGILARNLGIPAVINPVERFLDTDDGKTVLLDGTTGEIILEPNSIA